MINLLNTFFEYFKDKGVAIVVMFLVCFGLVFFAWHIFQKQDGTCQQCFERVRALENRVDTHSEIMTGITKDLVQELTKSRIAIENSTRVMEKIEENLNNQTNNRRR